MFVPEVFEMLQDSFRAAHKDYPFPNKGIEEAPVKFQAAIGEFTVRINDKIRITMIEKLGGLEEAYNEKALRLTSKVIVLAGIAGVSIVFNLALIYKFVM